MLSYLQRLRPVSKCGMRRWITRYHPHAILEAYWMQNGSLMGDIRRQRVRNLFWRPKRTPKQLYSTQP